MVAPNIPECLRTCNSVTLKSGSIVFRAGDICENFFFLTSGKIRVDLVSRSGKAIMLYRFGAGETCILTTSCLLSNEDYNAEAIVEEDVTAYMVPMSQFQTLLKNSEEFQQVVFSSFAHRLSELMTKIEEVTFVPLDKRLANRLIELSDIDNFVSATHDQIASYLGTAREVISRKLRVWETNGWVKRGRGNLKIMNPTEIKKLALLSD